MSDAAGNHPLILADFLAYLRNANFDIGVDDYLRVQTLLAAPGFFCRPAELKTILCPLFASSEKQQQRFYECFDAFFAHAFETKTDSLDLTPTTSGIPLETLPVEVLPARRLVYPLVMLAILLGLGWAVWLRWPHEITPPAPPPIVVPTPLPPPADTTETITTIHRIGEPDPPNVRIIRRDSIERFETRKVEVPNVWRDNWHWLVLSVSVLPLLAALVFWLKRKLRQRSIHKKHSGKHPPFTWPLSVPKTTQRLHELEVFNATMRQLRRRQRGEGVRLDVEASVSATIARFGFPALRFRPTSKVPEYLLLIDRVSLTDHQASFFNQLATHLAHEDVFVERYFFDGDPRICYRDDYRSGISLAELPRHNQRLLVYGDGTGLFDSGSGALADWAEWLTDWDDRALLTPTPPPQWGLRERQLSDLLLVSPATLEGLRETISHYELQTQPDLRATRRRSGDPALPNFTYDGSPAETADKLRAYLAHEDLFQWVCACAVYPELQWDLTLCLGEEVMPGRQLWEKDILRLARLPWFRRGNMPDALRYELLRRLTPQNQTKVSNKLTELLKRTEDELLQSSSKFENSWARESLGLQIDLQQWLAHHDDERAQILRERLRQRLSEMPPGLITRDYTTLREVQAEPLTKLEQKLNDALPPALRQSVFRGGIPLLGFLEEKALLALALPLFLGLIFASVLLKPIGQTTFEKKRLQPVDEVLLVSAPSVTPTPTQTPDLKVAELVRVTIVLDGKSASLAALESKAYSIEIRDERTKLVVKKARTGRDISREFLLPGGSYLLTVTNPELPNLQSDCRNRKIGVRQDNYTDVKCTFIDSPTVACFSPQAELTFDRRVVAPGTRLDLSARVQGGSNYGTLNFEWKADAGKIVSNGVNRASMPLYVLDTTGVAADTNINLSVIVNSTSRCAAVARAQIRVEGAAPPATVVVPDVVGQLYAAVRSKIAVSGFKVQLVMRVVSDPKIQAGTVIEQNPLGGDRVPTNSELVLFIAQATANAPPPVAQACYEIRLEAIDVKQDGEVSSPRWSFDILAEGKSLFALPAQPYSDRNTSPRQSYEKSSTGGQSGRWCGTAEQPFRLSVIGTNVGEKDSQQRTSRGELVVKPTTEPNQVNLSVRTPNAKDGDFTFRFTVRPARAATSQ